jgi:hypothetical protein
MSAQIWRAGSPETIAGDGPVHPSSDRVLAHHSCTEKLGTSGIFLASARNLGLARMSPSQGPRLPEKCLNAPSGMANTRSEKSFPCSKVSVLVC